VWQARAELSGVMVRAAGDPAIAPRLRELLVQGELLGRHHQEAGAIEAEQREFESRYELLELLPLSRAAKRQITQLFAATSWLPEPPAEWTPPLPPAAWTRLEPKLFPGLLIDDAGRELLDQVAEMAVRNAGRTVVVAEAERSRYGLLRRVHRSETEEAALDGVAAAARHLAALRYAMQRAEASGAGSRSPAYHRAAEAAAAIVRHYPALGLPFNLRRRASLGRSAILFGVSA
jgi:hypothetical protein